MSAPDAFHARVAGVCAALPGAVWADEATGELASWKVGGRMFASLSHMEDAVSVKCADVETAQMLIEAGAAVRAPYFNGSWVRLTEAAEDADLAHRLNASYALIRAALPASVRRDLGKA